MRTTLPLIVALLLASSVEAASFPNPDFAKKCVAGTAPEEVLVFADPEGKGWSSYESLSAVPPLELGFGMAVQVWLGTKNLYVHAIAYGEDHSQFVDYCFGPARSLKFVDWEIRTAWGWGFRPASIGSSRLRWFNTESDVEIPWPESASEDLVTELTPRVSRRFQELPFSQLLPKHRP